MWSHLRARTAAQAAVEAAAWRFGDRPVSSEIFNSPRRRAEEYLAGPSASQSSRSEDKRRLKSSGSLVSGSSSSQSLPRGQGASRAWHQGLARRKQEVQLFLQEQRRRLLKSLQVISDVKSALHDADARQSGPHSGAEILLPEVWEVVEGLLHSDLHQAAAVQQRAEEEARLYQELKAKLRVSSAALEVEAALGACDDLRSRIEEVQRRLQEARSRGKTQGTSKAQAHALIRSFAAVLLPRLPDLMQIAEEERTASEAATIRFLHAAQTTQSKPGSSPASAGRSALAQARAARSGR